MRTAHPTDGPVTVLAPFLMIQLTANNRCMLRTRWSEETINDSVDPLSDIALYK